MSRQQPRNRSNPFYRPLAIAALVSTGILQPLLPVFASGTAAGLDIINQATASYTDPSGQVLNATSNEVTIKVAEVAGLTNAFIAKSDVNGGAVGAGDTVNFDFQVTNTGNKATDIYIPTTAADLTLTNLTFGSVVYSLDGGTTFIPVPTSGPDAGLIKGVAPDQSILVRVIGTVPIGLTPGDDIKVQLGQTGDFTDPLNPLNSQNRPDITPNPGETDVATSDIRTVGGTPVNGQREAAAVSTPFNFADSTKPLALAVVKKRNVGVVAGDTTKANDDKITYELGLDVASSAPLGSGFDPASLEGTDIQLNGSTQNRILVSDRIPAGTKLESVDFAAVPAGWQVVYATDAASPATSPVNYGTAPVTNGTNWILLPDATALTPAVKAAATRIGYIYTGTLAPGASVSSLKFTVVTSALAPGANAAIANIAQVFGQTAGDPGNEIVYDESGDSNPNNFNGGTAPLGVNGQPDVSGTYYDPTVSGSGVANPTVDGLDSGNNNGGSGLNGEDNVVSITPTSDSILNGPGGAPSAKGPTDENDDFNNASTALPPTLNTSAPGASTVAATPVKFTNTVNNPSATATLANVTLQPISPSQADLADGTSIATGQYGTDNQIPNGTLVTIKYDPDGVPGSGDEREATYTYTYTTVGSFAPVSSKTGTTPDATFTPVNTGSLAPGASINYTTVVALPGTLPVLTGYSIPVVAFPDDNVDPLTGIGNGFTGETTNNITLDRVYTGYMQLSKQARILDASGTPVDPTTGALLTAGPENGWTTSFATAVTLQPGQFIEYRIKYSNISGPTGGNSSGNSVLTANDFTINEDGVAGSNTWSVSTTHQKNTVVSAGSVKYYNGLAVVQSGTSGAPNDPINDYPSVTRYENNAGQVLPGAGGQLQFRRKLK
jgi:hypothetical protein